MSTDAFECPIALIKIRHCPVTTCSYQTQHADRNCLMHRGLTEDPEFNSQEISKARGLPISDFRSAAQKGQRQIQRVLVLNDFMLWLDKLSWDKYPYVEGYHDPLLVQFVEQSILPMFPFNLAELGWNMGKIASSINDKMWKGYSKHKEIEFVSVNMALGVPQRRIDELQDVFKSAHKRALLGNKA